MQNKKFNIHDYVLLASGIVGGLLLIYGLVFQVKNNCESAIYGVKTNDTVIVAACIVIGAIFYKHIGKYLRNKFGNK